ncbi:hypothetical protein ANN_03646 [Periplaneta americana]|uniref:Uncharacterized protein n=1 Tax=Periplaneta americana TaxID=6978 RepID=A0ABQ8TZI1_PERAM|nr:hypothetical protein ANN_03646 [Periplaneta americana]
MSRNEKQICGHDTTELYRSGLSANDDSGYDCSANDKSAFYRYKTARYLNQNISNINTGNLSFYPVFAMPEALNPSQLPIYHDVMKYYLWVKNELKSDFKSKESTVRDISERVAIKTRKSSYPPYLEAVSSIRNLRTHHAVVIEITKIYYKSSVLKKGIRIKLEICADFDWKSEPPDIIGLSEQRSILCSGRYFNCLEVDLIIQSFNCYTHCNACTVIPFVFALYKMNPNLGEKLIGYISVASVPEFCPARVLLHASKCTDMSLSHLNTLKCHRPGPGSNPQPRAHKASATDYATEADSREEVNTLFKSVDNKMYRYLNNLLKLMTLLTVQFNYGLFNNARNCRGYISVASVPEFCPAGVLLHATKSSDTNLSHLSTLKCHRPGPGSNPQPRAQKASAIPTAPLRASLRFIFYTST